MFVCCNYYFRLPSSLISIHTTCISLSLRRTSASIHLTSVLGVLGTQETSCILIAGLLERDIFDLNLPEFDKPWVIHLRETCCCSTNLCTWRPNTVYKSRSICRHHEYRSIFAWSTSDLVGVPSELAEHHINVNPKARPVKQSFRRTSDEKRKIIGDEVAKLLAADFIMAVLYPDWLANPVLVEKTKSENPLIPKLWRMCI